YSDLVFSRKQRDGAHLTQVQPHRVKRFVFAGFEVYIYVLGWFFRNLRRFLFLDTDRLPERLGLIFIDLSNDALNTASWSEVFLSFFRGGNENVFIDSVFHFVFRNPSARYETQIKSAPLSAALGTRSQ